MKRLKHVLCVAVALGCSSLNVWAADRLWENKSGKIIKAEFIYADEEALTISMQGKIFLVKLASLSPQSQAMAKQLQQVEAAKGKPLAAPQGGPKPFPHGQRRIFDKLKKIHMPGVQFIQTPLAEVLDTLMKHAWERDSAEDNPAARGVYIIADLEGKPAPQVTITLNGMSLKNMLNFTTELLGWTYVIRDDSIMVSKNGVGAQKSKNLNSRPFDFSQAMLDQLQGPQARDPFGPPNAFNRIKIMQFLEDVGIQFDAAKGHRFEINGTRVIVTNSPANLVRLEKALKLLRRSAGNK